MGKTKAKEQVAASLPDYILGYGSLIEFASRTRTAPNALYVRPVRVNNLVRGWFAQSTGPGYSPTYLGACRTDQMRGRPSRLPFLNGVLYYVTPTELAATDLRENAGYERKQVALRDLVMLDGGSPPAGNIWIYLNKIPDDRHADDYAPSAQYPIVQSYVDICVNGALEIEANFPSAAGFAKDLIESTYFWSNFWVNDRPMPRRPFMYRSNAGDIDNVLHRYKRDYFMQMRIEPATWEGGPQG
jgi:hypothetical protein